MTAIVDRRAGYVSAVAVELADLAPDERAELIEELDDHVAALLTDRPDADLVAELGTPRAYAAELRSAAGLAAPAPARVSLRGVITAQVARVDAALPSWVRPTLRLVRPAWWVLRGVVVALVVARLLGWEARSNGGVVVVLAGVVASLWLAQRPALTPGWRRGVLVLNLACVLGLFWAWSSADLSGGVRYVYDTQYVPNCPSELSNLYGYDAAGRPLTDVRLYDQYGNPFDLSSFGCSGGQFSPQGQVNAYPWPSASDGYVVSTPTGPPTTLAPLPGATVDPSVTPGPSSTVPPASSAAPTSTP